MMTSVGSTRRVNRMDILSKERNQCSLVYNWSALRSWNQQQQSWDCSMLLIDVIWTKHKSNHDNLKSNPNQITWVVDFSGREPMTCQSSDLRVVNIYYSRVSKSNQITMRWFNRDLNQSIHVRVEICDRFKSMRGSVPESIIFGVGLYGYIIKHCSNRNIE